MDAPVPVQPKRSFFRANRAFFLSLLILALGAAAYFWWQAGFTFDVSRFFAAPLGEDCILSGTTCNGNTVWNHYLNCGTSSAGENCSATGTTCRTNNGSPSVIGATCVGGATPPPATPPPAAPSPSGCILSGTTCNGNTVWNHYLNCGTSSAGENCSATGTTCRTNNGSPSVIGATCVGGGGAGGTPSDPGYSCQMGPNGSWSITNTTNIGQAYTAYYTNFDNQDLALGSKQSGTIPPDESWGDSFNKQCIQVDISQFGPGGLPLAGCASFIDTNGQKFVPSVSPEKVAECRATPTPTPTSTPTPTPTPVVIACNPATQNVLVGQAATLNASGAPAGTSYTWYAPGGTPPQSATTPFNVSYTTAGTKAVTVVADGSQAACIVLVSSPTPTPTPTPTFSPSPTPTPTPTPTFSPSPTVTPTTPALNIQKTVRNVSQNGAEVESAAASPGETVEFIVRVSSTGTGTAIGVMTRDALPAGLSYQSGSTTIDSVLAADGLVSTGLNLGDMVSGRTSIIRFRATVANEAFFNVGTTTLPNTAYARAQNAAEVSDPAFVTVTRGSASLSMSLTKSGRNVSRNETGDRSPVYATPSHIIEFVLRIRNTSAAPLTGVRVRDVLPQGITFTPGAVAVNGQPQGSAGDALVTSGILAGSLAPGQEFVVIFRGTVNATGLPTGTTTLINTAYAWADNVPQLTAQLPIIITIGVITPPSETPLGPGESTVLALIISTVITLLYVGYTSTDSYRRGEAKKLAGKAKKEKDLFDFKR